MIGIAFQVGDKVVRTTSGYVQGRVGEVVAIEDETGRLQVNWSADGGHIKTWVKGTECVPHTEEAAAHWQTERHRRAKSAYLNRSRRGRG